MSNQTAEQSHGQPIETDVLIIGAGPAGASLASFLASYGNSFSELSNNRCSDITDQASRALW
jgi:flavin-dependent dehydrogenase